MELKIRDHKGRKIEAEFLQFSGGERHVQLSDKKPKRCPFMTIEAKVTSPSDFIDLCLLLDAIKWAYNDSKIELTIPYLPYSRQDRVCAPGQAFSLKWAVHSLFHANASISQIRTWDIHNPKADLDDFGLIVNDPIEELIRDILVKEFQDEENLVIVAPDGGAVGRASAYKTKVHQNSQFLVCDKNRDPNTGRITGYRLGAHPHKIVNRDCLIVDDICDGGMTFNLCTKALKDAGARSVYLFVTHGIFSKGLKELKKNIDHIWTTTSIPRKIKKKDRYFLTEIVPFEA